MNNKTTRNSFLLLVTAAVWGAAFVAQTVGGQKLNAKEMPGCCLIFAAIILAQLPVQRKAKLADEVMGRTRVSKKSKYFWKKILILTWVFSLFLVRTMCGRRKEPKREKRIWRIFKH